MNTITNPHRFVALLVSIQLDAIKRGMPLTYREIETVCERLSQLEASEALSTAVQRMIDERGYLVAQAWIASSGARAPGHD